VPSHLPCFRIQVAQFAIRRLDLAGIDLGMMSEDVLPPCFVDFFKGNNNNFLVLLEGAVNKKQIAIDLTHEGSSYCHRP